MKAVIDYATDGLRQLEIAAHEPLHREAALREAAHQFHLASEQCKRLATIATMNHQGIRL